MGAVETQKVMQKMVRQKNRTNNKQSRKVQRCHKIGCGSSTVSVEKTRKQQNAEKQAAMERYSKKLNEMSAPKIRPEKASILKIRSKKARAETLKNAKRQNKAKQKRRNKRNKALAEVRKSQWQNENKPQRSERQQEK